MAGLNRRIEKLRREAIKLIQCDDEMRLRFGLLIAMPGIGEISALQLLGGKQPCRGITWWAHPDDEPTAGR
ncbi:MAG: hypothetical protein ABR907_13495 [Terracidiphilus sp.]|jgi:hypothetical protein